MSYWYLGSPYSKYDAGLEMAFVDVCRIAGEFARHGIPVYSPIAHTHPIARYADIDPYAHTIWMPFDKPLMEAATGLIVAEMVGWQESYGLKEEIKYFREAGKPVFNYNSRYLIDDLINKLRSHNAPAN